ncbi:MAG: fluoride efflux transporter CrcB [Gammaproteobacteria bacterium]|nr:MAG: fluoride efflux transporter CrcB [Gammaproteobacteria bacterium]
MIQALAIAGGGAIGALMRFYASTGVYALFGRGFPYGTLFVNVVGSLLMGILYILFLERMQVGPEVRSALLIGVLGAFTTFSTFSMETLALLENGEVMKASINIVLSVALCILAAWLGVIAGRQL